MARRQVAWRSAAVSKRARIEPASSPAAFRALAPEMPASAGTASAAAPATTATTTMSSIRVKPRSVIARGLKVT